MNDFQKRITKFSVLFFILTASILALIHFIMTEYKIPDPPNYVTIIVEIAIGFFIASLVYMITRKQQSDSEKREKERTLEEHQHYKERMLYELSTLVFRLDTAISQIGKEDQKRSMVLNLNDVKVNLEGLRQINSLFSTPTEIRSQCDDLLSYYHIMIVSAEQGEISESRIDSSRNGLVDYVKKFIENEFFSRENNEIIDKRLSDLQDQLTRIISKTK